MPESWTDLLPGQQQAQATDWTAMLPGEPEGPALGVEAQRFFPRLVSGARSVVGGLAETAGGGLAALGETLSDRYVPVALQGPGRLLQAGGETLEEMGARAREQERLAEQYDRPLQPGQTGEFFSDLADAPLTTLARDTPGVFGSLAASILTAGAAGPALAGPALGISEQFSRARAEGQPRGRALAEAVPTGAAIGALESLSLGKILGAGRAKRLVRRIGEVSATEGGTEAAQALVSDAGATIRQVAQGEAKPEDLDRLIEPEALRQYAAEGVLGAIGGGLAGAVIPGQAQEQTRKLNDAPAGRKPAAAAKASATALEAVRRTGDEQTSAVAGQELAKREAKAAEPTAPLREAGLAQQNNELTEGTAERDPGETVSISLRGEFPKLRDKATLRDKLNLSRFWQSATDTLRQTTGLEWLGDRIDTHFDNARKYRAQMATKMRPAIRQFNRLGKRDRQAAEAAFGAYFQAVHEGQDPTAVYAAAPETARALIDTWLDVANTTGDMNQAAGVKVFDPALGEHRPIGRLEQFFPRVMPNEVRAAIANPSSQPQVWNRLVDALLRDRHIESRDRAEAYIRSQTLGHVRSNDFFAGMERARGAALPVEFFDFSLKPALRYIERWAERFSQIEQFGQDVGQGDVFDQAQIQTLDEKTKRYIKSVKDRVYEVTPEDSFHRAMATLNHVATGAMLGNWATATLNLFGGTTLNFMSYGPVAGLKAFRDMVRELPTTREDAQRFGVLSDDYVRLIHDIGQGEGDPVRTVFNRYAVNPSEALSKAVSWAMKYGGYTPTEHLIRMNGMLAGKHALLDALNSKGAKRRTYARFFQEHGFDLEALAAEGVDSPLGEKWQRYAAELPQGQYRVGQTPVFVDSPIGKFLFKFQKFATQVNRLVWKVHMKPFLEAVQPGSEMTGKERARAFMQAARFFWAVPGGMAIAGAREALFNYIQKGPGLDEIEKALDDDDTARGIALMLSRAYHSMIASGALGLIGNYSQMVRDVASRERFKSPLDPPGLAAVKESTGLILRLLAEAPTATPGTVARAFEDSAERFLSGYRAAKRPILKAAGRLGVAEFEASVQEAEATRYWIGHITSRWADEQGIPGGRAFFGRFLRTERSPWNDAVIRAVRAGDTARAKDAVQQALGAGGRNMTAEDRTKARNSLRASVRNAQPISLHGRAMNKEQTAEFLKWAEKNLGVDNYKRLKAEHDSYQLTAIGAGVMGR